MAPAQSDAVDPKRASAAMKAAETRKEKAKKKQEKVSASVRGRAGKKEKPEGEKKKRGPTAFFVFSGEQRAAVKKANPEFKVTEIATKLGEMWRAMSAEKKAVYEKKAADLAPK